MTRLFININQLVGAAENLILLRGAALKELPIIHQAFLLVKEGMIAAYGKMSEMDKILVDQPAEVIDLSGQFVLPAWCDSHSHLVFAKSRESEFVDKIDGISYAEIAAKGGGILNSAKALQQCTEEELYLGAVKRLAEVTAMGTGAIEIKSGYGLSVDAELKMLRVIKRLKENTDVIIKSTFLGAHAFPAEYKDDHSGYIRLITEEMLPVIREERLADFIDVFCELGFFSVAEMETICKAGIEAGLQPKLHVNQLNSLGGIQLGISLGALSVDHLEVMTDNDVSDLAASGTIGTLLPTAAFFLRMPYQPARQIVDSGAAIALASDYNPGSSPSGNMNFVVALSCIQMRLHPEEAINAATINGAFAMGIENIAGSISVGKVANLIITKPLPSLAFLPYSFGSVLIDAVMIKGNFIA